MNSFQRIMDRLRNQRAMQQNAQAAIPFTPNNGNPNGANNMPIARVQGEQAWGTPSGLDWMNPSPSMDAIQSMLQEPLVMPKPLGGMQEPIPMPKPVVGIQEPIPMPKPQVNFGTPMPKPVMGGTVMPVEGDINNPSPTSNYDYRRGGKGPTPLLPIQARQPVRPGLGLGRGQAYRDAMASGDMAADYMPVMPGRGRYTP